MADRITSAVLQRIEKFRWESRKDLDRLFGRFGAVRCVTKKGAVPLIKSAEQVPDFYGALQEDQHIDIPGSREFADAMVNRSSV